MKIPRLNLFKELQYTAWNIIIQDIQQHITDGRQITESPLKQRSESYNKWKKKRFGHLNKMILYDVLRNSLVSKSIGGRTGNKRKIFIRPKTSNEANDNTTRDKVGAILQENGDVWFGISNKAEARAFNYMSDRVRKILNGRR